MRRTFPAMLLMLALVLSLSTVTLAAEPAALTVSAAETQDSLDVSVCIANGTGVTNGRVLISYDATVLTLVGVTASDACAMNSINTGTAGTVALAWIGSDLTADSTLMLSLQFESGLTGGSDTVITVTGDGIYAGTDAVEAVSGSVTISAEPDPTESDPTESAPAETEPSQSAPTESEPAESAPVEGDSADTGDLSRPGIHAALAVIAVLGMTAAAVWYKREVRV